MNTTKQTEVQKKFIFGLDLGQVQDYTALVILERTQNVVKEIVCKTDALIVEGNDFETTTTVEDAIYHVRYIERMRNLPYPAIVERVKLVINRPEIENNKRLAALVIDQTGVGRPVYDLFKKEELLTYGITITGGITNRPISKSEAHVAKVNLVAITQVISQARNPDRLKYAKGLTDLDLLRSEIATFRVQTTKAANEIYAAREGAHDDLILALALGLWFGEMCGNPKPVARSFQG